MGICKEQDLLSLPASGFPISWRKTQDGGVYLLYRAHTTFCPLKLISLVVSVLRIWRRTEAHQLLKLRTLVLVHPSWQFVVYCIVRNVLKIEHSTVRSLNPFQSERHQLFLGPYKTLSLWNEMSVSFHQSRAANRKLAQSLRPVQCLIGVISLYLIWLNVKSVSWNFLNNTYCIF